jgi:hypothetical protein
MNSLRRLILHPFCFAVYPIVALLAFNIREVRAWVVVIPLLASLAGAAIILGILRLLLKDWYRAALITSFILLLFFSYGHVYHLLENTGILGVMIGRHRVLIPLYLILLVAGLWLILKVIKNLPDATLILNVFGITLVVIPLLQIGFFGYEVAVLPYGHPEDRSYVQQLKMPKSQPPDIYYIILDTYTRGDVLQEDFNYDNTPFTEELKKMGFYVADCSQSNYAWTRLSLSSSLNLNYLKDLGPQIANAKDTAILTPLIKQSLARKLLEDIGYTIVAFETGFTFTEWYDSDRYISPPGSNILSHQLQPFTLMLMRKTALKILDDELPELGLKSTGFSPPTGEQNGRLFFVLNQLNSLPAIPGPKFVFVHIIVPHPPFIFAPNGDILRDPGYWSKDGDPINEEYFKKGYVNQVQFINNRILPILQTLIAQSPNPPVIIVQGDHGVRDQNRLKNLSAFYLPANGEQYLYPNITPVNIFRIVFNTYFGTNYSILPDKSYMSPDEDKFALGSFTESLPNCQAKY